MALKQEVPLFVCFCLPSKFLNTTYRQYSFMIKGLQEVEKVQYYEIVMSCGLNFFDLKILKPASGLKEKLNSIMSFGKAALTFCLSWATLCSS